MNVFSCVFISGFYASQLYFENKGDFPFKLDFNIKHSLFPTADSTRKKIGHNFGHSHSYYYRFSSWNEESTRNNLRILEIILQEQFLNQCSPFPAFGTFRTQNVTFCQKNKSFFKPKRSFLRHVFEIQEPTPPPVVQDLFRKQKTDYFDSFPK